MIHVRSARDLGLQFTGNPHRMVGQDGAYSIPLGHGESLWFFGDTLVGARVPGESLWFPGGQPLGPGDMSGHGSIERLLTNSGCIVSASSGENGLQPYDYILDPSGMLKQLIPRLSFEHPDEIRVWCFHGIELEGNLYLYYQTVCMLAEGPMPVNFEIIGSGLARGRRGAWEFERLLNLNGESVWWTSEQPQFGAAVLNPPHVPFLYLYGVKKDNAGIQRCHVARVDPERIANQSAYEYFKHPAPSPVWSPDVSQAMPVMSGMPNELSVSWNNHLNSYLAVHSLDLTGRIVARTAPDPWGPWSEPTTLWTIAPPSLDYTIPYAPLMYAGKEHPALSRHNGRVLYLTYVEFEEYFPHLIEVELN